MIPSPTPLAPRRNAPARNGKLRFTVALFASRTDLTAMVEMLAGDGIAASAMILVTCAAKACQPAGEPQLRAICCKLDASGSARFDPMDDCGDDRGRIDSAHDGSSHDGSSHDSTGVADVAAVRDAQLLAGYLRQWAGLRPTRQLLEHLAHGGVALAVRARDENELHIVTETLLRRSRVGVQTHEVRLS